MISPILPLTFAPTSGWFGMLKPDTGFGIAIDLPYKTYPAANRFLYCDDKGSGTFSIPLDGSSLKGLLSDVRIVYRERWQSRLINTIRTAYGKSPYFEYYEDRIRMTIERQHEFLYELNLEMLKFCLSVLKIGAEPSNIRNEISGFTEITYKTRPYYQTFADKNGFQGDLSLLDLLFHLGPESSLHLYP